MGSLFVTNASGSAVTITDVSVNDTPLIVNDISVPAGETGVIAAVQSSALNFTDFQFNVNATDMSNQLTSYQVNLNYDHWFGGNGMTTPAAYPGSEVGICLIISGFNNSDLVLGMAYNLTGVRPYYASGDSKSMNPV